MHLHPWILPPLLFSPMPRHCARLQTRPHFSSRLCEIFVMSTFSPRVLCMNQVVNPSPPAPCSHLSQGGGGLHGLCGNRVRGQESCCAARVYAQKGGGGVGAMSAVRAPCPPPRNPMIAGLSVWVARTHLMSSTSSSWISSGRRSSPSQRKTMAGPGGQPRGFPTANCNGRHSASAPEFSCARER